MRILALDLGKFKSAACAYPSSKTGGMIKEVKKGLQGACKAAGIGRLAVDNGASGRGVGETLLIHALRSAQQVSEIVGLYAVVVDALNQQAKNFYIKYGFNELSDDHLHPYLPMKTIKQLKL